MADIFGFFKQRVSSIAGSNFAARTALATVAAASTPDTQAKLTPALAELPFVKATGELPVTLPKRQPDGTGLGNRRVNSSPYDDWYLALPPKMPPKQVLSILRQAAAGNLWNQYQLDRVMEESWPMYKKCKMELKFAIASAKYVVHPYIVPGKKPTKSAEDKADLVTRALNAFKPNRFTDEDGCNGMIFDLAGALEMGISIVNLIYDEDAVDPQGRNETMVRASCWVNPRNIACTPDGRIGVADVAESGNMSFSNQVRNDLMMDEDAFIVAKFKSKSGSPLTAGLMRTLADIWTIVVYGRDFARLAMQKYGNPFIDLAYASGTTDPVMIARFEELARLAAANGYCAHPSDSTIVIEPGHTMGADNAQIAMMRLADEACQLLLLGQTLTSSAPVNGGTRGQGEVHENVRQEIVEHFAKWMARILTEQFAESVCRVNYEGINREYSRNPERPTVEPDLTRPMTANEQAQYLKDMSQSKVPTIADETYKRAGCQQPSPGDKVLIAGELVIMEEPMTPTEKRQNLFDEQLNQQVSVNEAMAESGSVLGDDPLSAADETEIAELESLVKAAESAPHRNGEIVLVKKKWQEILSKKRI